MKMSKIVSAVCSASFTFALQAVQITVVDRTKNQQWPWIAVDFQDAQGKNTDSHNLGSPGSIDISAPQGTVTVKFRIKLEEGWMTFELLTLNEFNAHAHKLIMNSLDDAEYRAE